MVKDNGSYIIMSGMPKKKKKVCHAYFHHLVGREKQRNDNIKFRIVGLPLKGRKRNAIRDGQIGY